MKIKRPKASSPEALRRMQVTKQRDTAAELNLRRAVHALGLRFRVDQPILPGMRRRADLVFLSAKTAVFVDGCFWHCCPIHRTFPKANAKWWVAKLRTNLRRDENTNEQLRRAGWMVARVWEHDPAAKAAERIFKIVQRRIRSIQRTP